MRAATIAPALLSALALACGGETTLTAPPPMELGLTVVLSPDATGGVRPSTAVTARLFENEVINGELRKAEFTLFDAQGGTLAVASVEGPLAFGPDHAVTIRQVLDWTPADVFGRRLHMRFVVGPPGAGPIVIDSTLTF